MPKTEKTKERGENRDKMLSLRLTGTEWAQLEDKARQAGLSVREYARRALLSGPAKQKQTAQGLDFSAIQGLIRIGSLLHNMATDLRIKGQGKLSDEVLLVSRQIETILDEAIEYGPESRR